MDSIDASYAKLELDAEGWGVVAMALCNYRHALKKRIAESQDARVIKYYSEIADDARAIEEEVDQLVKGMRYD